MPNISRTGHRRGSGGARSSLGLNSGRIQGEKHRGLTLSNSDVGEFTPIPGFFTTFENFKLLNYLNSVPQVSTVLSSDITVHDSQALATARHINPLLTHPNQRDLEEFRF